MLSLTRWTDFAAQEDPALVAVIKKHQLVRHKRAVALAEAELALVLDAAVGELRKVNDKRRAERAARLESITLAIRDVWASDDAESAKVIVAKFIKS